MMKLLIEKEKASKLQERLDGVGLHVSSKVVDGDVLFTVLTKDEPRFLEVLSSLVDEEVVWLETFEGSMKVKTSDMLYFESINKNTILHTSLNQTVFINHSLLELEELLGSYAFCRISKSVIVNLKKITYIKPLMNSKLELTLSFRLLEVNRAYIQTFKRALKHKGGI